MKQSRYTESQTFQILQILKEAEAGVPAAEFCRKYEIGNATFYKWRAKFGGMDTASMKRLKELEEENALLKKCMPMRDSRLRCYQRSLKKSGEAISAQGNGKTRCRRVWFIGPTNLSIICGLISLLSIST